MARKAPRRRSKEAARARSRTTTRPPGVEEDESQSSLLAKYAGLVRRYEKLQRRHQGRAIRHSGIVAFALAAQRSPVTGIAFVHAREIRARNVRFIQLEGSKAGWRSVDGGPVMPLLRDAVLSLVRRLEKSGDPHAVERWQRLGDEQTVDVRVERIGDVRSSMVMTTVVDVTESIRGARELEAARRLSFEQERLRAVGELASGFAHDFNNTLNAMNLWIARLGQSELADPGQRRAIDALGRIVADAAVRVGRLQDFSRNRADVPEESLSIADVVQQAVEVCRAETESSVLRSGVSFRIETSIPGDLPAVRGSAAELRHVFLNLLLNARDAMPRGGTVSIEARREGDRVTVAVEDEGTGIPQQHLSRVFDPFFTTKGKRGTGLGLSIAYQVMQRLGGSITAANGAPGGARFLLTFPLAPVEVRAPAAGAGRPSRAGQHVLVIDDDRDNLEATKMVLEAMGQTVQAAPSGVSALEHVRSSRFDLVLCDVGMPEMSGWEVAERIREMAPGTPVYLVTGWANEIAPNDPHRGIVAGVLPKPLGLDILVRLLGGEAR